MKKRNLIFVIIAFLSIAVSSCKKDKSPEVNPVTPPAMEYVKIDEFKTSNGKFDVEIYGVEKYFSGYNSLYFLVKDGEGNKLSSVDISMDLSLKNQDKTSKLPVNNPVNKLGTNGYFIGGAVFLVKGDAENTYDLNLKFKANGVEDDALIHPVPVDKKHSRVVKVFSTYAQANVIVSLVRPIDIELNVPFNLVYYISKEKEDGSWEHYENLSALMTLVENGKEFSFTLPYAQSGFYAYPQTLNFVKKGTFTMNLNLNDGGEKVLDPVKFDVEIE